MIGDELLTPISAGAVAASVLIYVLLDGTDLGVGMLVAFNRRERHRRVMVLSLLPLWDANETWLVLGGGALLALFPIAYAVLLPALYLPIILMVAGLILRAIALEFREHVRHKRALDALLLGGSLLATFCQGLILGTTVQGVQHEGGHYAGSGMDWLGPFPLFCASALVAGYLWLGACWLYWRSSDELHTRSRHQAVWLGVLAIIALVGVLFWMSFIDARYAERLSQPTVAFVAAALLAGVWLAFSCALRSSRHYLPLFAALGVVVLAFALIAVALFPLIVPPVLTIQEAASGPATQTFMLAGFAVLVPLTLFYNTFGFRVFAGKIRAD